MENIKKKENVVLILLVAVGVLLTPFLLLFVGVIGHEIVRDSQPVTTERLFNTAFIQPSFSEVLDFQEAKKEEGNGQLLATVWAFRLPPGKKVSTIDQFRSISRSRNAVKIFDQAFPNKSPLLADESNLSWYGPPKGEDLSYAVLACHRPTNTFFYLFVLDFRNQK